MLYASLALACSLAAATPPKIKIAVNELETGVGVDPKVTHLLSSTVTSELRRNPQLQVVSTEDIRNLLGFQRQKQLLNCADTDCLAEIGGALGAEQMLTGSLSMLGQTYVLILRRISVRDAKVIRDVARRYRITAQDALLDAIPQLVADLFPSGAPAPNEAVGASAQVAKPPPGPAPWLVAGGGGVIAATGVVLLLVAVLGGSTQNGVTSYTYSGARTANALGRVGEGLIIGGAAVGVGGLTWGLVRGNGDQP